MLTEVTTPHPSLGPSVARSVVEADDARRLRRDATAMVERLAVQARRGGAEHPVAAALAQAARISHLAAADEFAAVLGLAVAELRAAEAGSVPFGNLAIGYDPILGALAVDLLSLADLEAQWRAQGGAQSRLF